MMTPTSTLIILDITKTLHSNGLKSDHCELSRCSNKLRFYLFADDTNILYADKNVKALETTINIELSKFYVWLTANKLTLNIKRIKFHSLSSLSKTACLSAKNLHV